MTVEARITDTTVEILYRGSRIASHARSEVPYRHTTITEHRAPTAATLNGHRPE
jgi:hypothetical protein